jgi:hypothetical protein
MFVEKMLVFTKIFTESKKHLCSKAKPAPSPIVFWVSVALRAFLYQ